MAETFFRAKVRPLEWRLSLSGGLKAPGTWNSYGVLRDGIWFRASFGPKTLEQYPTQDAAKAACQRDHDARVKALLILEEE